MLKRAISITMVLCIFAVISAGCGTAQSAQSAEGTTAKTSAQSSIAATTQTPTTQEEKIDLNGFEVKISAWWDANPASEANKASPTREDDIRLVKKLEQKYNCKIKYVFPTSDWATEYPQKYTTAVMSGDYIADISFLPGASFYPGFVTKGLCMPLDDYVDVGNVKIWGPVSAKYATYNGKHYGVSQIIYELNSLANSYGIFFNKELFEKEGLPDPYELQKNKQWTWDKFREIAKKATRDTNGDGKIDQWGFGGVTGMLIGQPGTLLASNGANYTKTEGGRDVFALDDPAAIEAFQFAYDLFNVDKVIDPNPNADNDSAFKTGKLAMICGGLWNAGNKDQPGSGYAPDMTKSKYGIVFFPIGPKATDYATQFEDFSILAVPSTEKHPKEVGKLLTELYSPHEWDVDRSLSYELGVFDEQSIETLTEMETKKIIMPVQSYSFLNQTVNLWGFTDNFLRQKLSARAWIESIKAQAQKNIDETLAPASK